MLSISLLFLLIIILMFNFKHVKASRAFSFLLCAVLIFFVLELVSYGIILYQVTRRNGFLYINQQFVLDEIMKRRLFDRIYFSPDSHNSFYVPDAQLGYTLGKGKEYLLYESNLQGLRAQREYGYFPDEDTLRVAVFGDSFVFCDGEPYQNTWPHILEASVENMEVLNFGVSGYGLVQSVLRYLKDGLQFNPDVILFNYMTMGPRDELTYSYVLDPRSSLGASSLYRAIIYEQDGKIFSRAVSAFDLFDKEKRREYVYDPLGITEGDGIFGLKLFSISNAALLIKRSILTRRYVNLKSMPVSIDPKLNAKLIELLLDTAAAHNSQVIFFSPTPYLQLDPALKTVLFKHKENVYYIDAAKAIEISTVSQKFQDKNLFNATNHYNGYGNMVYAKAVAGALAERRWGWGKRQFKFDEEENAFKRIEK